jgi:hypothetical protein
VEGVTREEMDTSPCNSWPIIPTNVSTPSLLCLTSSSLSLPNFILLPPRHWPTPHRALSDGSLPGLFHFLTLFHLPFVAFSAMPSSMPSSAPTGQPTGQPTTMPTIVPLYEPPTSQPTSRPTDFKSGPLYANSQNNNGNLNAMNTQTAIIVFSCVGAVVLCLFIVFTCYFQDKYHNRKEEEKLHSLVEHHYNEDEVILDDGEGNQVAFFSQSRACRGYLMSGSQSL